MSTIGVPGEFNRQINNPTSQSSGAAKAKGKVVKSKGKCKKSDPTPLDLKTDAMRSKSIRQPEEQGKTIIKPRFSIFKKGVGKIGESIASIKSFFKSAKPPKDSPIQSKSDPPTVKFNENTLIENQIKAHIEPMPPPKPTIPQATAAPPETPAPPKPASAVRPTSPLRRPVQNSQSRPVERNPESPPTPSRINTQASPPGGPRNIQQANNKPTSGITKARVKPNTRGLSDADIRKIAHHRCLDRFSLTAPADNKTTLEKNSSDLQGFNANLQLSNMSNDIEDICVNESFRSNYTPNELSALKSQASDLKWASEIGVQICNAIGGNRATDTWGKKQYDQVIQQFTKERKQISDSILGIKNSPSDLNRLKEQIKEYDTKIQSYKEKLENCINKPCQAIIDRIQSEAIKGPNGVVISGGTQNHAMLYQVRVQQNGKYSFSILNSGDGLEKHHRHPTARGKYQSNATWGNLTLDQVSNPKLIRGLLLCRENTDVGQIYKITNEAIGRAMDGRSKSERLFHKHQLTGTCSNQVIQVLMHNSFSEPLYRKFKADLTSHTIDLFKEIKQAKPELDKAMLSEMQRVEERRRKKAEEARVKKKI